MKKSSLTGIFLGNDNDGYDDNDDESADDADDVDADGNFLVHCLPGGRVGDIIKPPVQENILTGGSKNNNDDGVDFDDDDDDDGDDDDADDDDDDDDDADDDDDDDDDNDEREREIAWWHLSGTLGSVMTFLPLLEWPY